MTTEEISYKITLANEEVKKGNIVLAELYINEVVAELDYPSNVLANTNELRGKAIITLCRIFMNRGNFERSLSLAQTALDEAQEFNLPSIKVNALIYLGQLNLQLSSLDKAREYLTLALVTAEELGDKSRTATIYSNIAVCYVGLGDYDKAFEYNTKALTTHEELGDKSQIAIAKGNIGVLFFNLQDYEKAKDYMTRALEIHQALGEKLEVARTTGNLGNVYYQLGINDRALECYLTALALHDELGQKSEAAHVMGNIGSAYIRLGSYDEALDYFTNSNIKHKELGVKAGVMRMTEALGRLYMIKDFKEFDLRKAESLLLEALAMSREIKSKQCFLECSKILYELYESENRISEALRYFKLYHDTENEVRSEQAIKQAQLFENRRLIEEAERDRQVKLAAFKAKETILYRVLPPQIAERIADGEEQIADYFPTVSILFADIEGFTPMTADMPAHLVVKLLNHVFRHFDQIMKKHGCEKIKTIGDGYMAVAGAPTECADHAERMAAAAVDMIQPIELPEEIMPFIPEGKKFSIRIGIHTGSVVAGVVGEDRFVYDIYSDAVNTAARMESHGENGRIHVSAEFMKHLSNRFSQTKNTTHGIRFESRGELDIKGKGKMKTYFLNTSD